MAFWPLVASMTSQVSCGAPSARPCRPPAAPSAAPASDRSWCAGGPAVSAMTTSVPSAWRALDGLEDHRRGIGALLAPHHRRAHALAPDLQLLGGRGAEGVARGQQHALALAAQLGGQLADGRGLAAAVDPDDQQDEGAGGVQVQRRRLEAEDLPAALAQERPDRLGVAQLLACPASACMSSSSFWLVRTPMSAVSSTFSISSTRPGSISLRPVNIWPRRATQPARVLARPGTSAAASRFLTRAAAGAVGLSTGSWTESGDGRLGEGQDLGARALGQGRGDRRRRRSGAGRAPPARPASTASASASSSSTVRRGASTRPRGRVGGLDLPAAGGRARGARSGPRPRRRRPRHRRWPARR